MSSPSTLSKSAERGKTLLETGVWNAPYFDATTLAQPLDWSLNPFDNRSWVWLYQQLAFTNDLLSHDRETTSNSGVRYLQSAFESWWDAHKDRETAPAAAWHDHGSARRVENLLLLQNALMDLKEDIPSWVCEMVSTHAHFLADPENYTQGTNHGLDQSIALYRVAAQSPDTEWQDNYAKLAGERIADEISYAFASDGGHRENSVQYHNFGILQLLKIRKLQSETEKLDIPKTQSIEAILGLAVTNFAHLIGPGATLHQIGDTAIQPLKDIIKGSKLPRGYKHYRYSITKGAKGKPPSQTSLVLPESGWVSFRNHWDSNAVHLLSHCGFTSNYHRHDDDASFSLKAHGEDWIIDSGLYQYKEQNPYRRYMRSYKAHNLLAPTGASPHRRFDRFEQRSKITAYHLGETRSYAAMTSMMFEGYHVSRSFDFDIDPETKAVKITISDSARPADQKTVEAVNKRIEAAETTYTTRFILPMDKDIEINAETGCVFVTGQTHIMRISGDFIDAHIISGVKEPKPDGWRSKEFGSLMPSQVLEIRNMTFDVTGAYQISWSLKDTL